MKVKKVKKSTPLKEDEDDEEEEKVKEKKSAKKKVKKVDEDERSRCFFFRACPVANTAQVSKVNCLRLLKFCGTDVEQNLSTL